MADRGWHQTFLSWYQQISWKEVIRGGFHQTIPGISIRYKDRLKAYRVLVCRGWLGPTSTPISRGSLK